MFCVYMCIFVFVCPLENIYEYVCIYCVYMCTSVFMFIHDTFMCLYMDMFMHVHVYWCVFLEVLHFDAVCFIDGPPLALWPP